MRKALLSGAGLALAASLSFLSSGCIKKMLVDGQIEGTREASVAFDRIGDYELARSAAESGLVQFEGMLQLSPGNKDALFMLAKGWAGYGFGFAQDAVEAAEDAHDDDAADYHRKRARQAYDTAIKYGLQLIDQSATGFDAAKKDDMKLKAWLSQHFFDEKDAANLFWVGYAWLVRVDLMKGDPELGPGYVADLFVGVDILERVNAIAPAYEHFGAPTALAAYHARSPMAEMDQAQKFFDDALAKTQNKALIIPFTYATTYACVRADGPLYEKLLRQVDQAEDPDPEQRLTNAVAKRRAHRWLRKARMKDACSLESTAPKS